jgi:hypothetical protein
VKKIEEVSDELESVRPLFEDEERKELEIKQR